MSLFPDSGGFRQALAIGSYNSTGETYVSGDGPSSNLYYLRNNNPNIDTTGEMGYPGAPRPETLNGQANGMTIGGNGVLTDSTTSSSNPTPGFFTRHFGADIGGLLDGTPNTGGFSIDKNGMLIPIIGIIIGIILIGVGAVSITNTGGIITKAIRR